MKRAELVYKCVKGFMMEVASWGGSEIKTLQVCYGKYMSPPCQFYNTGFTYFNLNYIIAMLKSFNIKKVLFVLEQ